MKHLRYFVEDRSATWLELFFDLIFVIAIGKITHLLAHVHDGHLSLEYILKFPLVFIPVWWIWVGHTMFANRFDTDSNSHRLSTLLIMFLIIVMSIFLGVDFENNFFGFILCYFFIKIILVSMIFGAKRKHEEGGEFVNILGKGVLIGAIISLVAIFFESPTRHIIVFLGLAFDLLFPLFIGRSVKPIPVDTDHLVERHGLLTIILLGESILSISSSLSEIDWGMKNLIVAITGFTMVASIWWIYYDKFELLIESRHIKTGQSLIYSHLFMYMGLAGLANVIRHALLTDIEVFDFRILSSLAMISFLLGKEYTYIIAKPELRKPLIRNLVIFLILCIPIVFLPKTEYILIGMTAIMVGYIILSNKYTYQSIDSFKILHHE